MKRVLILAGLSIGFLGGFLFGQSDSDFQSWMKTIAPANGALNKGIAAKDAAAVGENAKKLEDAFTQVESYWQKKGAADAVGFAKQAKEGAAAVSKDAASGNFDMAANDAKAIGASCGGCHGAHREKGDSGYKIK